MKEKYFLYSIGILAIVGVLVCFFGYATNTLPMHTPKHISAITMPAGKKKNCKCCTKPRNVLEKPIKTYLNETVIKKVLAPTERPTQ